MIIVGGVPASAEALQVHVTLHVAGVPSADAIATATITTTT